MYTYVNNSSCGRFELLKDYAVYAASHPPKASQDNIAPGVLDYRKSLKPGCLSHFYTRSPVLWLKSLAVSITQIAVWVSKKALFDTKHDCYALHHNSCCVRDSNSLSSRARFTVWCDTPSSPTQLLLKRYCYIYIHSWRNTFKINNVYKHSNILVERLRIELSKSLMRPSGNLQDYAPWF